MTELEQIENRVLKLSPADFEEFRKWFREQEWDEWDREIERDSDSEKFKDLTERVLAEHAAGRTSPIRTISLIPISGLATTDFRRTSSGVRMLLTLC